MALSSFSITWYDKQNSGRKEGDRLHTPNPWTYIWLRPRAVIRDALTHDLHKRAVVILSLIFGFLTTLSYQRLQTFTLLGEVSLFQLFLIGIIGSFFGPILYYGAGALVGRIGSLYGGNGDVTATRKSLLFALFMPGILLGFFKVGYFTIIALNLHFFKSATLTPILQAYSFLIGIADVWIMVVFLIALAEAQQVKLWRAFLVLTVFIGIGFICVIALDLLVQLFV